MVIITATIIISFWCEGSKTNWSPNFNAKLPPKALLIQLTRKQNQVLNYFKQKPISFGMLYRDAYGASLSQ